MRVQVGDDVGQIGLDEGRQQEPVVQLRAPPHQRGPVRLAPEPGHQGPHEQDLHQRHLRVRRHLEAAQLEQSEPAAFGVRAEELVDAELGPVGVAGDVGQQVAQRPVNGPGPGQLAQAVEFGERDLEFIERFVRAPRRPAGPGWSGR